MILVDPSSELRAIPTDVSHTRCLHLGGSGMQNEQILWSGAKDTPHIVTYNLVRRSPCKDQLLPISLRKFSRVSSESCPSHASSYEEMLDCNVVFRLVVAKSST